jgi:hypothetical protein
MPRVLLTIVLPLLLPMALYLVWAVTLRRLERHGPAWWTAWPWVWLAGAGIALLAIVLFVVTVHFGGPREGVYVPPHLQNGQIVPGHIEPKSGQ